MTCYQREFNDSFSSLGEELMVSSGRQTVLLRQQLKVQEMTIRRLSIQREDLFIRCEQLKGQIILMQQKQRQHLLIIQRLGVEAQSTMGLKEKLLAEMRRAQSRQAEIRLLNEQLSLQRQSKQRLPPKQRQDKTDPKPPVKIDLQGRNQGAIKVLDSQQPKQLFSKFNKSQLNQAVSKLKSGTLNQLLSVGLQEAERICTAHSVTRQLRTQLAACLIKFTGEKDVKQGLQLILSFVRVFLQMVNSLHPADMQEGFIGKSLRVQLRDGWKLVKQIIRQGLKQYV